MNLEKMSSKPVIHKSLIIISMLLWFVGFAHPTGFGLQHNILEITKTVTIGFFFLCAIFHRKKYRLSAEIVFSVAFIFYIAITNEIRNENNIQNYVWVWLLIPIMKSFSVEKSQIKWIGYMFGIASTAILLIGNVTDVFAGWDGNSISIVQFFSYTVFMAVFADIKDKKNIRNIVIFSVIYFYLLNTFGSRSAILFSAVMMLCMLPVIPLRKYLSKSLIMLMLLLPLIIAVVVVVIKDFQIAENLNNWSLQMFNKPIFNGRDTIWAKGFETWKKYAIIGNGDLNHYRYHNSAVTCLVAGGIIGYTIWIGAFYRILSKSLKWLNDSVVYGLITSFLVIWLQQSVDLGLISTTPNVIPYLILGLLYARVHTLEDKNNDTCIDNNTDLQHG